MIISKLEPGYIYTLIFVKFKIPFSALVEPAFNVMDCDIFKGWEFKFPRELSSKITVWLWQSISMKSIIKGFPGLIASFSLFLELGRMMLKGNERYLRSEELFVSFVKELFTSDAQIEVKISRIACSASLLEKLLLNKTAWLFKESIVWI